MDIHTHSWRGLLSQFPIDDCLRSNPRLLEEIESERGITPLAASTIRGHIQDVKLLLNKGANVNKQSRRGVTPLLFAAWRTTENRATIIRLLLEHGAYVDATCPHAQGNTPLMLVFLETRPIDIESVMELRKRGASLTLTNDEGKTALDLANMSKDDKVITAIQQQQTQENEWRMMKGLAQLIIDRFMFLLSIIPISGLRAGDYTLSR
jgi:ankyrin repeat protein